MFRQPIRSLSTHVPWFVDPVVPQARQLPRVAREVIHPLPSGIPSPIKELHSILASSPHLDHSQLVVREPIPTPFGPPLPYTLPKGKRGRGGTYAGEGIPGTDGGIWSWIVIAQVKEGTENRGAIESVVRVVRKSLLQAQPSLSLPSNSKKRLTGEWAMIDAGQFAVHILSKDARLKFFPPDSREF